MSWALKIILLSIVVNQPAMANGASNDLTGFFKNDFVTFMSADWKEYSLREFFSKLPKDFTYLDKTFGKTVRSKSQGIHGTDINIEESGDLEGGYDLGILILNYRNESTASSVNTIIMNAQIKNLKGGKIFIGYTSKLCGNNIVLLYSRAVLTDKIKTYFKHVKKIKCQPT